jgi:type II secretory pathway component PulJ
MATMLPQVPNYLPQGGGIDPFGSLLQGAQIGAQFTAVQQQQAAREQAMRQQEEMNAAVNALVSNPNPRFEDYQRAGMLLPKEQGKLLLDFFNARTEGQRNETMSFGGKVMAAAKSSPEVAMRLLRERAAGERNAGREDQAKAWETWAGLVEQNPDGARATVGALIATLPGGEKVFKALAESQPESWERVPTEELQSWGWSPKAQIVRNRATGELKGVGAGGTNINLTNEGAIPPGFQAVRDEQGRVTEMRPIPGSPAAQEQARRVEAEAAREEGAVQSGQVVSADITALKDLITNEQKLKGADKINPFNRVTGVVGKAGEKLPGSARVSAKGYVDSITSNIGFDKLNRMRQESPTGGALGNISNVELGLLQSTLGSLNLDAQPEVLLRNLNRLGTIYNTVMRKAAAYPNAQEYGFAPAAPAPSPAGAIPPRPANAVRRLGE